MPETIDGALYRRKAFLLGFMTKAEADGLFAMNPLRVPGGATPAAVSQAARAARTGLGGYVPGTADPIPAALSALVDEIRSRNVYKKEYEAKADYEFRTVPIDSLLTPQTEADLDYVDELAGSLTDSPDDNKDFAFAFPTAQIAEPITVGNTLTFTSNAPNIAVTPGTDCSPNTRRFRRCHGGTSASELRHGRESRGADGPSQRRSQGAGAQEAQSRTSLRSRL